VRRFLLDSGVNVGMAQGLVGQFVLKVLCRMFLQNSFPARSGLEWLGTTFSWFSSLLQRLWFDGYLSGMFFSRGDGLLQHFEERMEQ